jgi:hypothetical protein
MFAQGLLDFGLTEGVLLIVRIIATVGGAVVGWFVCDPLTRIGYRLSFRGATPGSVLLGAKLGGSATAALLIWFFMPLGGPGGGLGWGPGLGGGPGKGPGQGADKASAANGAAKDSKDTKDAKNTTSKSADQREPLKIEILGGPRFKNDGEDRYYLLKFKETEAVRSLAEVEDYLKQHHPKLIEIIHTEDTAVFNTEEDPTRKLQKLASKYDIPHKDPKD